MYFRFLFLFFAFFGVSGLLWGETRDSPPLLLDYLDKKPNEWFTNTAFDSTGARVATYEAQIDLAALSGSADTVVQLRARERADNFRPIVAGPPILIRLPTVEDDLLLDILEAHEEVSGVIAYSGWIEGVPAHLVTLVIDEAAQYVSGKFHYDRYLFVVEGSISEGTVDLHVIDKPRLPAFDCRTTQQDSGEGWTLLSAPDCNNYSPNQDNGNVRILFYYTSEVASNVNVNNMISGIISEFNSTTFNSGVDPKNYISKAGAIQTSVNFNNQCPLTGCCSIPQILGKMDDADGEFSDIQSEMDQVYADMAFVLVSSSCNRIGGAILLAHDMNDPKPFAVSTDEFALSDLTALHEIGHVLGSGHEATHFDGGDPVDGAPNCARGFLEPLDQSQNEAGWQTMMGGYGTDDACEFEHQLPPDSQNCVRLPLWSHPNISHLGKPTGSFNNPPEEDAFNGRALNMTMTVVAEWGEPYPDPAPSAPTLNVQSAHCFGLNDVSWSSVNDAEHYQLFKSLSSQSSWTRIFHGEGTFVSVNVPQADGSWDIRVRACNGSGCGNFSNIETAEYFPGCL